MPGSRQRQDCLDPWTESADMSTLYKDNDLNMFPFAAEQWHETVSDPGQSSLGPERGRFLSKPSQIPHQGSLCRIDGSHSKSPLSYKYTIEITLETSGSHELCYERQEFEFMSRLFAILDTESRGSVGRGALREFVTLRCPVFWRRDEDLRKLQASVGNSGDGNSPTFDEVWTAVARCSKTPLIGSTNAVLEKVELGVEGWMVFCRFIALAQYLEAKRQFSARHLQQTMRHRNSPRGSEVVVVDVPPPESPAPLTAVHLADYERKVDSPLPLPELDLDHSLVAAHDAFRRRTSSYGCSGIASISLFGSSAHQSLHMTAGSSSSSTSTLEFAVTYSPKNGIGETVVVRRSFGDMKWLNDTFSSHKVLGGTLCGRILPPFPSVSASVLAAQYQSDDNALQSAIGSTGGAIAAAAAGVDLISSAAKSLWGSYVSPPSNKSISPLGQSTVAKTGKKVISSLALPESYYNPNSPIWKARQLERYLNYLLEHPALSTSFPLNTILKASQSGLEAAKLSLEDHARASRKLKAYNPQLVDGKISLSFWKNVDSAGKTQPNLSWVRTAAQAAMALKVHGILETTGLPSASARLQHASLPTFDHSKHRNAAWMDEDGDGQARKSSRGSGGGFVSAEDTENFESGVIQVESELDVEDEDCGFTFPSEKDGYDLLPLPVPAPERRILCAGSSKAEGAYRSPDSYFQSDQSSGITSDETKQARFHYGTPYNRERLDSSDSSQVQSAFLGEFSVDDNIDKLREVIVSVEKTLSRCLAASAGIGGARSQRLALHLDVVRGFDSWEGMRGQFITQRALLKGVSDLEHSRDVCEESDLAIIDDVSWQTSLASSAVLAAEDVRSTVRAARTAASAKAAADAAAFAAQNTCDGGPFPTINEAQAAQTRFSIAQSQAIHAAVVEHEANTAKRRAALALAHDVKCWNVHRKRELLHTCLSYARSQHIASHNAAGAWSCLRDGYLGSASVSFTETKKVTTVPEQPEVTAVIYPDIMSWPRSEEETSNEPSIVATEHDLLAAPVPDDFDGLCKPSIAGVPSKDSELDIDDEFGFPEDVGASATEGEPDERDPLSASMQSLVDGLMTWGGQFDTEEDLSLPTGMATSIVLEESGVFVSHR